MVDPKVIEDQLKRIDFKTHGWGRTEVKELPHILLPDEAIHECVNGIYEGGFALLVATDTRVLLVDKKPLNYLTVEDMRYDLISEIDYSHRLLGANISIASGDKALKFRSYNQQRLRKLVSHVQHCKKMQSSHQEDQKQHLEQINQQLQAYLFAQYEQQEKMHKQLQNVQSNQQSAADTQRQQPLPEPLRPSHELADYLYAQRLMAQYQQQNPQVAPTYAAPVPGLPVIQAPASLPAPAAPQTFQPEGNQLADLYADGMQEIYGKRDQRLAEADGPTTVLAPQEAAWAIPQPASPTVSQPMEINPMHIAYAKIPAALRSRKSAT